MKNVRVHSSIGHLEKPAEKRKKVLKVRDKRLGALHIHSYNDLLHSKIKVLGLLESG